MTSTEFKYLAGLCVSEDVMRPALRSAFYWGGTAIVTDGRIALVADAEPGDLPAADEAQQHLAQSLHGEMLPEARKKVANGKYEEFKLDIDRLVVAVAAVETDIAPEMDELRHYEPDPDDPDDFPSEESERFVLSRYTMVILPNVARTVIAGYYASVVANCCLIGGNARAYMDKRHGDGGPLYLAGQGWELLLMPLYVRGRTGTRDNLCDAASVADAATGLLVNRRAAGRFNLDKLRFPREGGAM